MLKLKRVAHKLKKKKRKKKKKKKQIAQPL